MTQLLIDRTTLEQLVGALETGRWNTRALAGWDPSKIGKGYNDDNDKINAALTAGRAALAGAERVEPDTQRLDFMFLYDAFLSRTKTDADTIAYQLLAQDEDEDYVVLSGEDKFFPTGRAAVDAAREKAKP